MALLWKLTKRVVIPAGAVVSIPFVVPLMYATESENDSNLTKPSELPIYESQKASNLGTVLAAEKEPSHLLEAVSAVRKSIFNSLAKLDESKDLVVQYYEISKDHTITVYNYLTAEENVIPRAVAITVGGLSGLLFSARKGIFKKVMYTTTGLVGMSFVCYPKQATQVSQDAYKIGKYYVLMAYSRWQESGTKETKLLVPAVLPQPPPPPLPQPSPPPPTPPPKPPVVPNYSFVDRMTEQVSDVNYWGFRLLDRPSSSITKVQTENETEEPSGGAWIKSMVPVRFRRD